MRHGTTASVFALALLLPLAHASAQTTTSTTTTTPTSAFDKLSSGNQKIASAIFEAQVKGTTTSTTTSAGTTTGGATVGTAPKPLTLNAIAQRKLSGQGWGVIYRNLKAQGLVTYKNLGQAVSAYNHNHHLGGLVTTASGRAMSQRQGAYDAYERRGGDDGAASGYNSGRPSSGGGGNGGGNSYGRLK